MSRPIDRNDYLEREPLDEQIAKWERHMLEEKRKGPRLVPTVARIKKHIKADPALSRKDAEKVINELMEIVRRVRWADELAGELAADRTGRHWDKDKWW
jgi:hypothetical protein